MCLFQPVFLYQSDVAVFRGVETDAGEIFHIPFAQLTLL